MIRKDLSINASLRKPWLRFEKKIHAVTLNRSEMHSPPLSFHCHLALSINVAQGSCRIESLTDIP